MQPPFPCPTASWHNDTYESISPRRSGLSAAGKTVIVIGAGSGIGRATALAFAEAGASHVALLGRTEATLQETGNAIATAGQVTTSVHTADLTKAESLEEAAGAIGKWHVLVLSSAYVAKPSSILSSGVDDWWQAFETNVKGTLLALKAFLPRVGSQAAILGLATGVASFPADSLPGLSAYTSSKLCQTRIIEFVASENPDIFAASVHPGMVETDIFYKTGGRADILPIDRVQLPAHFLVWMASPEAAFLKGRSVWANWDVEELKAQKQTISEGQTMMTGFNGWPFITQA
ncbi:hypothetical protein VPNG_08076 [Cytospora leucostoma]|uniref:Ketoreductase domain-containing protein n=1 Tax=Cytospora leucostoma TaxID=1230097 RepID=A0A423WRX6_9PEZI|nr:hypothetical protein VPNG_08076 [Cytospora leucostoma]